MRPHLGPSGPEEERKYKGQPFWYTEPIRFTNDIGACLNHVPSGDYMHSMRYLLAGGRADFWPSYDGCAAAAVAGAGPTFAGGGRSPPLVAIHYNGFHQYRQKLAAMKKHCDHPRDFAEGV